MAPQAQLEGLLATLNQAQAGPEAKGNGKEVAEKVDVGKVAEKVVKNVSPSSASENGRGSLRNKGWARSRARRRASGSLSDIVMGPDFQLFNYLHSFGGDIKLTYVSSPVSALKFTPGFHHSQTTPTCLIRLRIKHMTISPSDSAPSETAPN
jgi:hypothetical protein